MAKSSAERKAAQRARQSAAGNRKIEITLDIQELAILERNCSVRRPGRDPYDVSEYISMLIRQDDERLKLHILAINKRVCRKCGDRLPVKFCPCQGDSQCWATMGWHETKLST